MLFGNEKLFSLARSAKLGQIEAIPILARLQDWIHAEFPVQVIHIVLNKIEHGPTKGRPRLNVILETQADVTAWKTDKVTIHPDIKRRILQQFIRYAKDESETFNTEGVFLVLDNFSGECIGQACSAFLRSNSEQIINEFAYVPIWKIDGLSRHLVVFLMTDRDIQSNTANGLCAKISNKCFDAIKPYDEFGYLTTDSFRLKFDSKENLDKNYAGNLFYYWR